MFLRLKDAAVPVGPAGSEYVLFFSFTDGTTRARVETFRASTLAAAWRRGVARMRRQAMRNPDSVRWLRVDIVDGVRQTEWGTLKRLLTDVKRNYCRQGISLDPEFRHAFLETEINANAMFYGGPKIAHCVVNEKNIRRYARRRHGLERMDICDDKPVWMFTTRGYFIDSAEPDAVYEIAGPGRSAGRRLIEKLDENVLTRLIASSSSFLAGQVGEDGQFVYGWHPCFDREIEAYNGLRHASTTYAMIEAWEVTRDERLWAAIERSLAWLLKNAIRTVTLPNGKEAAFLVDVGNEIKLGANAVTILAFTKHAAVSGSSEHLPLLEKLALGVQFMQRDRDGSFVHVLNYPDLTQKEAFRTIYYEGEAAFGLMRLYSLTKDERWLQTVEKAFEHFIAREHWRHNDHWLSYCVNELTRYRPEERYFRFGIQNVRDYLDFVLNRITTFPTLLELMMASQEMIERIGAMPETRHLLDEIDLPKFRRALHFRARYLKNGYFWPELAMFFANPERIVGSFFIRHHAFRVRIDDVEHYLSGLIAYLKHVHKEGVAEPTKAAKQEASQPSQPAAAGWTAANVAAAAHGTWVVEPPEGWRATGLSTFAPAMQPGNLVVVRTGEDKVGMLQKVIKRMSPPPAGIMATNPSEIDLPGLPLLGVANAGDAVLAMGRYARSRMTGKVIAVTGSAGKSSTVAMMAHALSPWGPTHKSAHNANLPHGVAWNLASIPWDTPHAVIELAIGRMAVSARMARPDVAIFTNILPAHLGQRSTTTDIARTKSAIFLGMEEGSCAVLNRDMAEWDTVLAAAMARKLQILTYGEAADCDFRLVTFDATTREVHANVRGNDLRYRIGPSGKHMALNSLAVLAAASALGHDLEPALQTLEEFSALPGRGEEFSLDIDGRRIRVVDDAYNANPGSMAAALERLDGEAGQRRIAVLGEMADLGPEAASYHTELAEKIGRSSIDRVYAAGDLYAEFWRALCPTRRAAHVKSPDALKDILLQELADGDVVLFKGSNSTRVHELVAWLKERGSAA